MNQQDEKFLMLQKVALILVHDFLKHKTKMNEL